LSAGEDELRAAFESCALADRSADRYRLRATGPDMLDLLNRLSTAALAGLAPGAGKPTVLTTNKGRIVDYLLVFHLGEEGLLLTGAASRREAVEQHLKRYALTARIGLADASSETVELALIGPRARDAATAAGLPAPAPHATTTATVAGSPVHVLGHDGLSRAGLALLAPQAAVPELRGRLETAVARIGGRPISPAAVECWRILCGLPLAGHELTEEHNPLEAGLWDAVSFDKGCYVGQEVVARLRTYDKVSRALVGLELAAAAQLPEPGTPLYAGTRAVGSVTSAVLPPDRPAAIALGYVKRRELGAGLELRAGDPERGPAARVVALPFHPARGAGSGAPLY
jgi:folate-binding protein YgfZ